MKGETMKQHITPKQFKEISKEQSIELFDFNARDWRGCEDDFYTYHHKKITVGKMIEILDNSEYSYDIKRCKNRNNWILIQLLESGLNRSLKDRDVVDRLDSQMFESDKLCDVLWEAIKMMIKN